MIEKNAFAAAVNGVIVSRVKMIVISKQFGSLRDPDSGVNIIELSDFAGMITESLYLLLQAETIQPKHVTRKTSLVSKTFSAYWPNVASRQH